MTKKNMMLMMMAIISLSACGRDDHNHPTNLSGKALFELHCASCHGPSGDGSFLLGVPANNDTRLLNAQIRYKIQHGKTKDDKMPVFATMPDDEANKVIQYLHQLAQHQ